MPNSVNRKGTAKYYFEDIITVSQIMKDIITKARRAAAIDSPVIICGETGTGKELFVQSIHNCSRRATKPFIAQNCAAIPFNLLESIIFGTVKGSFTGAENKRGILELANEGTLYLDELNSMPLELQSKLLRVIQDGKVRRVGATELLDVDVRIIASMNEVPERIINEGKLRRDLFYRLNIVRIDIPPLRERREDIPVLIDIFIKRFNGIFNANIEGISKDVLDSLLLREWRGNVRELEHLIEGLFNIKNEGIIKLDDVKYMYGESEEVRIIPLRHKMALFEEKYIREALILSEYNISKAARLLDIPRQTLQYKMNKYGIKNINTLLD